MTHILWYRQEFPEINELIMTSRVRAKDHKKRALARIPVQLDEGLSFSVGV